MKVCFMASPRGNLEHDRVVYKAIVDLGYTHTNNLITTVDPEKFYQVDVATWGKRYATFLHDIGRADICVFEVSLPSLGIGQLVQEALRRDKPVVVMYDKGNEPYLLQGAETNEPRAQMVEYTIENLKRVLTDALMVAKELLETRFTMLMPAHLMKFLDEVSDKLGVSRSEYIRKLIEREMKKS